MLIGNCPLVGLVACGHSDCIGIIPFIFLAVKYRMLPTELSGSNLVAAVKLVVYSGLCEQYD